MFIYILKKITKLINETFITSIILFVTYVKLKEQSLVYNLKVQPDALMLSSGLKEF